MINTNVMKSSLIDPLYPNRLISSLRSFENPNIIIRDAKAKEITINKNGINVLNSNVPQDTFLAPGVQLYSRRREAYTPAEANMVTPKTIAISKDANIVIPEYRPASKATLKYIKDTNDHPTTVAIIIPSLILQALALSRLEKLPSRYNAGVPAKHSSIQAENA